MSIAVTESLMFKFCTTDGGIVRVMQKRGSGIEIFSAGQEPINRFGTGLETWGDNNARGDNKVGDNVWTDSLIGLKPDQNPTRTRPEPDQKCLNGAPKTDGECPKSAPEVPQWRCRNNLRAVQKWCRNHSEVVQKCPKTLIEKRIRTTPVQYPYNNEFNQLREMPSSSQHVFKALKEDGTLTVRGLASKLSLNKSTVSVAIGCLVKAGFIVRVGAKTFGGHWEIVD